MSIVRDSKFDEEASVASVMIGAVALSHMLIMEADQALLVISLVACLVPMALGSLRNILIGSGVAAYAVSAASVAAAACIGGLTMAASAAFVSASVLTASKYAVNRKNSGVRKIVDMIPYRLRAVRGDKAVSVPIGDVAAGDVIRIRIGEVIPFDGRIVRGSSTFDSSVLDGRTECGFASEGDRVLGGTVNVFGFFDMQVESVGADTAIYRMSRLIDRMNTNGTGVSRQADLCTAAASATALVAAIAAFATIGTSAALPVFAVAYVAVAAIGLLRMSVTGRFEWRNAESRFMRFSHVEHRALES